jgi:hypothetical protein
MTLIGDRGNHWLTYFEQIERDVSKWGHNVDV